MVEETVKGFDEYVAILRRRKWLLFVPALIIFVTGVVVAFALPPVYRSEATIQIERQEIPEDMVQSTVTTYADQRIQFISRRVVTGANLENIVETFDLYHDRVEDEGLVTVVNEMRQNIELEMVDADIVGDIVGGESSRSKGTAIAFTVAYLDESPLVAQQVTSELATLYLSENRKSRTEATRLTSSFLRQESERIERKVNTLESRLAEFKQKHADALPERMSANLRLIDRTEQQIRDNEREIRNLKERTVYLQSQLAQLSPSAIIYSADGQRIMGPEDQLRVLEAEYVNKAARYSDNHPDLVNLRREMAALGASVDGSNDTTEIQARLNRLRTELSSAEGRYTADHPTVKNLRQRIASLESELNRPPIPRDRLRSSSRPNNPAYIQLQTQLTTARIETEALQQSQKDLRARLTEYEEVAKGAPKVELELRQLKRGYDNQLTTYNEIKAKQMQAAMAESLEQADKGERLSLIETAQVPLFPVRPNRKAIIFLSLVFSITGGVGSVALREITDRSLHNAADVTSLLGTPPLSVVPYIDTKADERKRLRTRFGVVILVVGTVSGSLAFTHHRIMPLEDVWTLLLDRAGIDLEP